ncbi:MAG: D-aminoacyl-tRNA deacylase [Rikenellaceae bacterium]
MRLVIQRVASASVEIDSVIHSSIGHGLMVLVGIEESDNHEDIEWLTSKLIKMRIFDDPQGVMNLDVTQVQGQVMVVSQFTLQASTKKGNRPSYIKAAGEAISRPLYNKFIEVLSSKLNQQVATGEFGADMKIALINDGPVTILIDSKARE